MADGVESIVVSNVKLDVPKLGQISGLCFDGKTCQYLGIPYATIPGRFRRSKPAAQPWPNEKWDGTKFGPYCPQPPRDFYPVPVPRRPWVENPSTSDVDCLNLNISVPDIPGAKSLDAGLPIMVFIHGGAFTYAAGSAAMYDGRVLADSSRDLEEPSIIVTLNYRLGVYGFLASHEIKNHAESFQEQGVGNYGLWDQIEALRWIQAHIASFGGNPERVTFFGQSAGGVSVNALLLRDEHLFQSAILQSGLLPLCGIMTIDEYQVIYDKTLQVLGISAEAEDRHAQLLAVSPDALTASMTDVCITPVITFGICDDGVLIPRPLPSWSNFTDFKTPSWCPRVMIGDAVNECVIWNKAYRHLTNYSTLLDLGSKTVGLDAAKSLLDIYEFSPSQSPKEIFDLIEKFTTDAMYLAVNYDFMRSNGHCFAYHFNEPSPYDNEWGGLAHHSLDNVFIWGVLRHTLQTGQQELSKLMTKKWLDFANGKDPWKPFGASGDIMILKSEEGNSTPVSTTVGGGVDSARGYQRWQKVRELGLTEKWGDFAFEICIKKSEILDRKVAPKAMEVPDMSLIEGCKEVGVL